MTITFILPFIDISGGVKAVFEFANQLTERGHKVNIVYPLISMPLGARWFNLRKLLSRFKKTIMNYKRGPRVDWFDLKAKLIAVPSLKEKYIPKADVIVATWWETAYYVKKYHQYKGEKFYLVQDYEIWGGPKKRVNNSYKLGLKMIVNSTWLKNILENQLNVKVESLILHAPDRNQFYPDKNFKKEKNVINVLMPYRREKRKGAQDGIKVFEIVKKEFPEVTFSAYGIKSDKFLPIYVKFYQKPSGGKLREIYNSADIFLFTSRYEGFGMPPLEAMACAVPVVTTNVGAVPDYTIPGKTALVSEVGDIKSLAQNVIQLIKNPEERKKIEQAGYEYTKNISWESATDQLEEVFKKYIEI